jgi:dihydrolipoamide dehydrogenase
MNKYDIIVVGGGPGGYVAAIRAAQLGFKTAVIEKDAMGGVCLNWGCIPTKALLKSAKVYKEIVNAESFGIKVEGFEPKLKKMMERSQEVAEKMSKGVSYLMKKNKVNIINGYGWLKSNKKIEVTNAIGEVQLYEADHIIIATGGRAKQIENIAVNNQRVLDYMGILSLKKAPKNLVVVGGGAIGVEFASFFNAIGSNVTILEYAKHILPNEDEDVSKELEKILKNKGINIITEATVQEIEHDDENPKVRIVKYKKKEDI